MLLDTNLKAQIKAKQNDPKYKKHQDIYEELNMSKATYYRYLSSINIDEPQKDRHARTHLDDKDERIAAALDHASYIAFQMSNDRKARGHDRVLATQLYLQTEVWIYQNETYGNKPKAIDMPHVIKGKLSIKHLKLPDLEGFSLDIPPVDEIGSDFDK